MGQISCNVTLKKSISMLSCFLKFIFNSLISYFWDVCLDFDLGSPEGTNFVLPKRLVEQWYARFIFSEWCLKMLLHCACFNPSPFPCMEFLVRFLMLHVLMVGLWLGNKCAKGTLTHSEQWEFRHFTYFFL